MPNDADREPWKISGDPASSLMITCEHASNALPHGFDRLGVNEADLQTHIAIDIGADRLSTVLRDRLRACLISAQYSRLLVDLNRYPDDPSVVLEVSDETVIPGNVGLEADALSERLRRYHAPYHAALSRTLDALQNTHSSVDMLFVHSFTPQMGGVRRPWDLGLLFHDDGANAMALADLLQRDTDLIVGMNEPYSAVQPKSYALFEHAVSRGLRYLVVEVRQDLLLNETAIKKMADQLAPAIDRVFRRQPDFRSTRK